MRSDPRGASKKKAGPTFPWVLFLLFVASIYLLWFFPNREPAPEVQIDWEPSPTQPVTP